MKREGQKDSFRKMKVIIEEIKGSDCYTNFYGMDITREKLCTIVKKWHSIIEVVVQVKSQDGYLMRISCIGFTKRTSRQVKATCYAKNSQSKLIRKKITEILLNEAAKNSLRDLTKLL
jgi:small subunit ribosomal protein S3Ae